MDAARTPSFTMDPTTTLFTFLLHTHPSIQSVQLLGSWDNFSTCHKMEKDTRRDHGQWRGCHTFKNIICDGDEGGSQKRSGGLKMGQTYYYYYEVDGSTETHDPSKPTTNACPYLPGQTVNTLEVPMEQPSRFRSASTNSINVTDFRTMNPSDKFTTPRAAPPVPELAAPRVSTSPSMPSSHKRAARSLSPTPRWAGAARRFLGLKLSSRGSDRSINPDFGDMEEARSTGSRAHSAASNRMDGARSTTPSEGIRSRDISPESLRRFLIDDAPLVEQPKISIPEEIIEENEDDDNFATSAKSESMPVTTLSPPPCQRSFPSPPITGNKNESCITIVPETMRKDATIHPEPEASAKARFKLAIPSLRLSCSTNSSSLASPTSPRSPGSCVPSNYSFFDESNDDDDDLTSNDDDGFNFPQPPTERNVKKSAHQPFTGYSLPQQTSDNQKHLALSLPTNQPMSLQDPPN